MSGGLGAIAQSLRALAGGIGDDVGRARARWRDAQAARFARDHAGPIVEELRQLSDVLGRADAAMDRFDSAASR